MGKLNISALSISGWIQAAVEMYGINVFKISRAGNCADVLTHSLPSHSAMPHLSRMGFHFTELARSGVATPTATGGVT